MPAAGNTALLMPAGGQPNTAQPTHNHHHQHHHHHTPQSGVTYGAPQSGMNHYGAPQSGMDHYGPQAGGNNPYGAPQSGMPYGAPQSGMDPYAAPQSGINHYGPQAGGNNPYGAPQSGVNSYGGPAPQSGMNHYAPQSGVQAAPQSGADPYGGLQRTASSSLHFLLPASNSPARIPVAADSDGLSPALAGDLGRVKMEQQLRAKQEMLDVLKMGVKSRQGEFNVYATGRDEAKQEIKNQQRTLQQKELKIDLLKRRIATLKKTLQ